MMDIVLFLVVCLHLVDVLQRYVTDRLQVLNNAQEDIKKMIEDRYLIRAEYQAEFELRNNQIEKFFEYIMKQIDFMNKAEDLVLIYQNDCLISSDKARRMLGSVAVSKEYIANQFDYIVTDDYLEMDEAISQYLGKIDFEIHIYEICLESLHKDIRRLQRLQRLITPAKKRRGIILN